MRFIRARFGIVVWCAIALIILVVPLWRLRAAQQWSFASVQQALMPDYNSSPILVAGQPDPDPTPAPSPYGFSQDDNAAAVRRFPAEPIAQLTRLNVLKLNVRVRSLSNGLYQNYSDAKSLAQAKARLQQAQPGIWKTTDAYFDRYDALERRFPDSLLVRAQHLRDVTMLTYVSDPATEKSLFPANALVLKYDSPISDPALEAAIRVARQGARLQPDNGFFPWMEAIFQFALQRPDAALGALELAAKCSIFDDYTFRSLDERTRLLRRLRATGWEDDLTEWAHTIFPHYSQMRGVARAASWQMQLARQRNDKPAAFRWAAATARAAYPVARNSRDSVIGVLVGQAICRIVWQAAVQDEPNAPKSLVNMSAQEREAALDAFNEANVVLFADLARANGDDDLAQQTLDASASFDGRELARYSESDARGQGALLYWLSGFHWVGAQLLRLSLGSALLWGACCFFTRRAPTIAATRAQMLLPAMFCAGITGAILVGAFRFSLNLYSLIFGGINLPESEVSWMIAALRDDFFWIIAFLWLLLVIGSAIYAVLRAHLAEQERPKTSAQSARWLAVAALLTAIALLGARFLLAASNDIYLYGSLLITSALALTISARSLRKTAGLKRVLVACLVGAFWSSVTPLILQVLGLDETNAWGSLLWMPVAPAFAVAALLAAGVLATRSFGAIRKFDFQIIARARIAAGVLALLSAVAYFGIALWTIPVEAKTRAMMQRQLQIGEVAWLREQMRTKN